jgi:uncharacterized protein (TIGR03437 family)
VILRSFSKTLCALVLGVSSVGAANIGFEVNGDCAAGSCPAQPLGSEGTATLPVSTSVTLADGDIYSITGSVQSTNIFNPYSPATYLTVGFEIVYLGNGSSAASQDDTLTLDLLVAYSLSADQFFNSLIRASMNGHFGPTVASSSSVELCIQRACSSIARPPGAFAPPSFATNVTESDNVISQDFTYTVHFGSGSPVAAYIVFNDVPLSLPVVSDIIGAGAYGGFQAAAPGSWIEIYGSNLALGSSGWGSIDFIGVHAPTTLGGTSVTVGGQAAFVDYVSPGQVNVQVPSNVATGPQEVIVTTAAGAGAAHSITMHATEPGLLAPPSFDVGGTQYVVALFSGSATTYVLPPGAISGITSKRAKPGDRITIYGVGFGPVKPDIPAGQLVEQDNELVSSFNISFDGTPATVTYAGLAPTYVGVYQFNVTVPNVAASDMMPVTFTLGGASGTQTLYTAVE